MSLTAKDVAVRLGDNEVLKGVSCDVEPGRVSVIVGANGSGKSTLLRTLTGEYSPNEGSVHLNEIDLRSLSPLDQARRRALMSQNLSVAFDFDVAEILSMGWMHDTLPDKFRDEAVSEVARLCKIESFLLRTFNRLSGGEQQRVHFARALLQIWSPLGDEDMRYLLLDEPTSNLDMAYELEILKLTKSVSKKGVGALVVLHDQNLAARFADYVYLLVDGEVYREGEVSEVFTDKTLSTSYQLPIRVEKHHGLNRLLVIAN